MPLGQSTTADSEFLTGRLATTALAVGYMAVGIGFWVSLLTGWFRLFVAVLVGTVGIVVLSLYIAVRREGLLTAENKLIGSFVLVAMGFLFALGEFTDLPWEIVYGTVLVVGVLIPYLLLKYTDYGPLK